MLSTRMIKGLEKTNKRSCDIVHQGHDNKPIDAELWICEKMPWDSTKLWENPLHSKRDESQNVANEMLQ